MDGLCGVQDPTSEEQQVEKEAVAHVDQVECVERRKKIAGIQSTILRSNILKDAKGQMDSKLARATDDYLSVSVHHLVHLASTDNFNLYSRCWRDILLN